MSDLHDDPEFVAFRLAFVDLDPAEVTVWWNHGLRDATLVRDLLDAGLAAPDVANWTDLGLPVEEVATHVRDGISPAVMSMLNASGITDPAAQRNWVHTSGVPISVIQQIVSQRVTSTRTIEGLHAAGVTAGDIKGYRRGGFTGFDTMASLRRAGVGGDDAANYRREARVTDPDDIIALHAAAVSPMDVITFREAGVRSVREIVDLAAAKVRSATALGYAHSGIRSPDDWRRLAAAGIGWEEAAQLRSAGMTVDEILATSDTDTDPDT